MSMCLQFIFIPKSSQFIVPVGVVTSTELRAFDNSMLTKKDGIYGQYTFISIITAN